MHWILQDGFFHEAGMREMKNVLERLDIPHTVVKVVPFVGEIEPDLDLTGNVICWGAYSMRHLRARKGWYPCVFDLEHKAHWPYHNQHWKPHMLNADAVFCEFQFVGDFAAINKWDEFFFRPVKDSKVFAGTVMNHDEFYDWRKKVVVLGEDDGTNLRANTECIVAQPKKIYTEFRVWVVDQEVVTASLYKLGGRVHYSDLVDDSVIKFVEARVKEWPHFEDAYVMDVANTPDGLKIIEVNTINSAGLYAANVQRLITTFETLW